jgi:hypothetical protein
MLVSLAVAAVVRLEVKFKCQSMRCAIAGSPGVLNPALQSGYVYLQGQHSQVPSPAPSPAPVEPESSTASPRYPAQHPDLPEHFSSSALNLTPPRMSLDESAPGHHSGTHTHPPSHPAFAEQDSAAELHSLVHVIITPSPASSPNPLKVQLSPSSTSATSGGGKGAGGEVPGLASPRKPQDLAAAITASPKLLKEQQFTASSSTGKGEPATPTTQTSAAKVRDQRRQKQALPGMQGVLGG